MNRQCHWVDSSEEDCDRIFAAQILLKVMKFIGLWQWQWQSPKIELEPHSVIMTKVLQNIQRSVVHIPFTFIFITLMWIEAFRATDLDQMGDVLYMSLTEAALIVKICNIWYYSAKANNFIYALKYSPDFALNTEEERKFWNHSQKKFRQIIYMYAAGSLITVFSAFLGVLFLDEPQMGFAFWVPFEWQTIRRNYWIAYFYNVASMACTATSNVCLDMMGCYFLFHVSLLYKILSFRLQKLKATNGEDVEHKFKRIFRIHRCIRKMTRECETLSSKYVLSQIVLSGLILCFCCYRIVKMDIANNFGQFVSMLQFLGVMILEIFLPCYFGNEITLNSAQLSLEVYSTNWLEFSVIDRKILILFMEFLKRPDMVKIGGYFVVGLPIFTRVINNAYSFFALLMNVEI